MGIQTFKILVVDDDKVIHKVTELVLKDLNFLDFKLEVLTAYSAKEAKGVLKENSDIALAMIDISMETTSAGLDLVDYIRNDLKNEFIRLAIRSSITDIDRVIEIAQKYDINDFIDKAKVGPSRFFTAIRSSIKQYIQLLNLQEKYEETYKKMTINPVTFLPNRIKFFEDKMGESNRTLILIDIVSFSMINEAGGHESGDYVLRELAAFLQTMYGEEFDVYHINSDLFALITKDEFSENIFEMVEKIKDEISQLHIITNNFNQTLCTTIGVAACSREKNLMTKAELALKEARLSGKNQIKYYSDDLQIMQSFNELKEWSPKLREGKYIAYYQPIYNLQTNQVDKYELLVRLEYKGELYSPMSFLKAAKESGQIYNIFKFMFAEACKAAEKFNYRFSVNIGDYEFKNDKIVDYIIDTLEQYKVNPEQLSLEVLEYSSIDKDTEVIDTIHKIHNLGIEIIIDDFGIECSNFGQIKHLPIDVIKIDGSFIKDLPNSIDSQIIVKTIKTFAKEKGIKLVAEFVCDEDVLDIVKAFEIEYGQGFHLGKPTELSKLI